MAREVVVVVVWVATAIVAASVAAASGIKQQVQRTSLGWSLNSL